MRYYLLYLIALLQIFVFACSQDSKQNGVATDAEVADSEETRVPIEAMRIRKTVTSQGLNLVGKVSPLHSVEIVSETSGKVEHIAKKLGDPVSKADTLARLDDIIPLSQYRQARAQVLSTENNLKIAELNAKSDEQLYKNGDISQLEYENSMLAVKTAQASHLAALAAQSSAEKQFFNTRITSPISGWISRKYIDLGTMVTLNMPVYRIVDISTVVLQVGIPQNAIASVKVGAEAKVLLPVLPRTEFKGTVRYISPEADEATGAFACEIYVKNTSDLAIRAGMSAKIELLTQSGVKEIAIPDYAIMTKDDSSFVYRITNGRARLVPVKTRDLLGSDTIVENGLADGDSIVVVGMKNLGLDTPVSVK